MCQYDRTRLAAHFLDLAAVAAHSTSVTDGRHGPNPNYDAAAILRGARPPG
jgi:hypothetical protein